MGEACVRRLEDRGMGSCEAGTMGVSGLGTTGERGGWVED
jgi:hypothetical protein